LLGSNARGMTEVDVFELFTGMTYQTVSSTKAALSTSYQVGPNSDGSAWSNWDYNNQCFKTIYDNTATSAYDPTSSGYCKLYTGQYYKCKYPFSVGNLYHGESGRDSISGLTPLTSSDFDEMITMRLEWEPKQHLRWHIKRSTDSDFSQMLEIKDDALAACGSTGKRDIPEEPQYMLFNTAMSDQAGYVHTEDYNLWGDAPYEFKVDYVRYYQRPSAVNTECSPPDYPTADFVEANPTVFANPDPTEMTVECTDTCGNGTSSANWTAGVYTFHDTRCSFTSIYASGCIPPYENMCRACFTKTAFQAAAFTADGVFSANVYPANGAPASKPICPPCVCTKWGLDASECAEQTLPGSTGTCTPLEISHSSGKTLSLNYCSNANYTSSVAAPRYAPHNVAEATRRVAQRPARDQLKTTSRRPPTN